MDSCPAPSRSLHNSNAPVDVNDRIHTLSLTLHVIRCPVYKTQQRGPTYVFDAGLRTKAPMAKWVLAGVVLVMDII